jgi:hypothetical protein
MTAEPVEATRIITPAESSATKEQLAACEARIEAGFRSFVDLGAALGEIRESRLYRLGHKTFEDYVTRRWDIGMSQAKHLILASAVVTALNGSNWNRKTPLPALESHARALSAAPEHLRGEVWVMVWEQTGGKPTAKAVTAAAESVTAAYAALEPVTADQKAAYDAAYEACQERGFLPLPRRTLQPRARLPPVEEGAVTFNQLCHDRIIRDIEQLLWRRLTRVFSELIYFGTELVNYLELFVDLNVVVTEVGVEDVIRPGPIRVRSVFLDVPYKEGQRPAESDVFCPLEVFLLPKLRRLQHGWEVRRHWVG